MPPSVPTPDRPATVPAEWVVAALPDGVWMFDVEGRTTYANDQMAALLGLAPDEVIGFSVFDALDEQGRSDFARHLEERDRTEQPGQDLEVRLLSRDGSARWTLASHTPVRDDDGRFRGWLYRVRDHSKQRELMDDLRRRDLQFAEAQATARIGTWERDIRTGEVNWSEEAFRLCGVEADTFSPTAEEFFALLNPEDTALVGPKYQRMLDHGDPLDVECRLSDESRGRTWLRIRGFVVRDEAGAPLRVGGTLQDITVGKNYRLGLEFVAALARVANQARSLSEVLGLIAVHVQPYAQWPAVLVAAPRPPDGDLFFLDAEWSDHSDDVREFARVIARDAAATGRTVQGPGPHGVVLVGGPVLVGDRLACVIVADTRGTVTALDEDLAFFNQMLVILAQVAEREWTAEELAAARDQALIASRAKSEFLATMSHEIRTPLNGVIGLSELLRRTELTRHQRRLADGVDQAGRTLLALVNDILDLSKIEAGRLDLEEVDFDPRAVIEQSAALLADRASAKGLELIISSAPDVPPLVRGDPVRFGQVITNLTSNAVKFTSTGEVVVRAHGQSDGVGGGSRVRVEVRDTGVGIEESSQDRLFEAFTQADSSTTREYGGTGLGLAISKRIVAAMGGDLGVTSVPGAGSTFWFHAGFDAPRGEQVLIDDPLEDAITGLRVLVVDDNATNRFILTEQLSRWGVVIAAVESTYDALVELDTSVQAGTPYDVALLDYMMPGADGEQLARIVRAERRHDRTRLALLSSAMEPTPGWLADAGIDAFLPKPVLSSRLLDVLATLGGRLTDPEPNGADSAADVGTPRGGRILVVEDNAINQLVAEGVLRRLGYEVVLADNGAAGVAAVADEPEGFVAILMDVQMPVMDGLDATRAVRAIQVGQRTPIIAMTASAVAEERDRCLDAGMDDFLTKPVNVGLLSSMLQRWVTASPTETETGTETETAVVRAGADVVARLGDLLEDGIDAAFVLRIITTFGQNSGGALAGLRAGVEARDADEIRQHAHALRGSAGNVGLSEVADLAGQIEFDARTQVLPGAPRLAALDEAVERGSAELDAFVREYLSPQP